jgi:hypothetical protein
VGGGELQALPALLQAAVSGGDFTPLEPLLAADAVLDTSSERGRRRIAGREAILDHLAGPGPGEVVDWAAERWPDGLAISFEWRGQTGTDRRRWYLRTDPEAIVGWWSYAARPRLAPGGAIPRPPQALIDRYAPGARVSPLSHGGNSGAALLRIEPPDRAPLIAKRISAGGDWLARITDDRGRTARLWEGGVFDRLPASIIHGIVAVAPDPERTEDAWVLMEDLSATFLGDARRLSREESRVALDAAAAIHAEFRGEQPPGAATLRDRLAMSSPTLADSERSAPDLLPKQFEAAWEAFAEVVDADVADPVLAAAREPGVLARRLLEAAGEPTLIHGDFRDDNLGLPDGGGVVVLDWDLATIGTPTVEFAWYLCHDAWRIDAGHDEILSDYLAAEDPAPAPEEVELGLISGLVQYGWVFGHSALIHPDPAEREWARTELGWWVPRVRRALESAGGI